MSRLTSRAAIVLPLAAVAACLVVALYVLWWVPNTDKGRAAAIQGRVQLECMDGILPRSRTALEELTRDDYPNDYPDFKVDVGSRIRAECEQVDCRAEAEAWATRAFERGLGELDEPTRRQVLVTHCWDQGLPANWGLIRPAND
jgi:hypothetical protein